MHVHSLAVVKRTLALCALANLTLTLALPASAADKKAKGPQLKVTCSMLFSLPSADGKPRVGRWTPRKGYPVQGATLQIDDGKPVTTGAWTGEAKLDLTDVKPGKHLLKALPPKDQESKGMAGPSLMDKVSKPPEYAWRRFEVEIVTDEKGLKSARIPQVRSGLPEHAAVMEVKPESLLLDWKPDWMRAKAAGDREGATIDMIVLHQTGGTSPTSNLTSLTQSSASAHYFVDEDGHAVKLVQESKRAFHAEGPWMGGSKWSSKGSVGFEILHSDKPKKTEFTKAQLATVMRIMKELRQRYPKITRQRTVGHSDVDPGDDRAEDPGWMFPWDKLEKAGLARTRKAKGAPESYFGFKDGDTIKFNGGGKPDDRIKGVQEALKKIGYALNGDKPGVFGSATNRILRRFLVRYGGQAQMSHPAAVTLDEKLARHIYEVSLDDTP